MALFYVRPPCQRLFSDLREPPMEKIVLAYSGGLDSSIIVRWLQAERGYQVVTFTANIGQGEELESARLRAQKLGAESVHVSDLREEFVRDFVWPMLRANAVYEGNYLLGSSISRPLIAKYLLKIAALEGAKTIAHGATGKGNDQLRFELSAYALQPDVRIVAPWREWQFDSRKSLLDYAEAQGLEMEKQKEKNPYSMDANLLHISYEGGLLEDPWKAPSQSMWRRTASIAEAPQDPVILELAFHAGDLVAINGNEQSPAVLLEQLNQLAGKHGVGRVDMVENRCVGMKSRGCYETPGGTVILAARQALESLVLDREVMHLKEELMLRYARLVYNGLWWSDERLALQKFVDATQTCVSGVVRLVLHKGNVHVNGRKSEHSLFDERVASFDSDEGAYCQGDAGGFIALSALRLKLAARRDTR